MPISAMLLTMKQASRIDEEAQKGSGAMTPKPPTPWFKGNADQEVQAALSAVLAGACCTESWEPAHVRARTIAETCSLAGFPELAPHFVSAAIGFHDMRLALLFLQERHHHDFRCEGTKNGPDHNSGAAPH